MGQKNWEENLKLRPSHKLKSLQSSKGHFKILGSPCDLGVIRNGGKRGTKHGPAALLNSFNSLVAPKTATGYQYSEFLPDSSDPDNFEEIQKNECHYFEGLINTSDETKRLVHLGGGHDHIYPLARALAKKFGPLIILNIDAHLDTRPDKANHSGTPFRQLQNEIDLKLIQIGIHQFANERENFEGMGSMEVLPEHSLTQLEKTFQTISKDYSDRLLILSVDCDGLDASFMPAVSAPNHKGLSQQDFAIILKKCKEFWLHSSKPEVLGLYEYNPIFDGLSQSSARYLAGQMYDFFYGENS